MSGVDDTYPISVLIDELKNEDVQLRLNSIKRLNTIGLALGPERTVAELIPFIDESCTEDEDEVLLALAEILGDFVSIVGGPKKAHHLLVPLKNLCNVEESTVRDKAVASLNKIASQMKPEMIETHFSKLIDELLTEKWFTSKSSACGLFGVVYPVVQDDKKTQLRGIYAKLCADDTPMVRRSAFTHLGTLASKCSKEHLVSVLIQLFLTLSQDSQDSVRLLAVENCIAFAKQLTVEEIEKYILPTVKSCAKDKSWRVRYMVAEHFKNLCSALGVEITRKELIEAFIALCQDPEAEVRTAAANKVADVASLLPKERIVEDMIPAIKQLVSDKSEHVRSALGSVIMGLAPTLEKDGTIKHLLPLFIQLLKDAFPEVRLNIISKLDAVNKVVGVELLSQSLLPAIVELAEDKQWRVRLAIIEYIPLLAKQLGVEFFDDKLSALCMSWLSDSVYSIREAATMNLKKLTEVFGAEWCEKNLLPKVLGMQHSNYLYRMTTLFAINSLVVVLPHDLNSKDILDLVIKTLDDPVPNVRFNAVKTLEIMMGHVKTQVIKDKIKPTLTEMSSKEKDSDVKFFISQALSKC